MTSPNDLVWCWCRDCAAWIGSDPPVLPPWWSNRKAQGLHRYGQPTHRTDLVRLPEALAIVERQAAAA